jgi:hypothetical protein
MNPDPETLSELLDTQPGAPDADMQTVPAAPTEDRGFNPFRSESIVGDHFFWASGSVLLDLS